MNNKNLLSEPRNSTKLTEESWGEVDPQLLLEHNYKFFLEYSKLYQANTELKSQLQCWIQEKQVWKQQLIKIEKTDKKTETKTNISNSYTNRKRHRRAKGEIKREYICEYSECKKSYGSEGSLNQHVKIKHKDVA